MPENLQKKPIGLLLIGNLNFLVFGLISFILIGSIYLKGGTALTSIIEQALKEQNIELNLNNSAVRQGLLIQIIMAVIYFISGIGLLLVKSWARRFSLCLALFLCILVLVSAAFNPQAILQAIIQILYPASMIFYLTNKNVIEFFKQRNQKNSQANQTID